MLGLADLGESPLVVRVRKRYRRFVVAGYRLGCFGVVVDSCFVQGCRTYSNVLIVGGVDYKVEVGCVFGTENAAGRNLMIGDLAVRKDRVGSADCRPG